jgi:8-amino-7-oxononanoate synthase
MAAGHDPLHWLDEELANLDRQQLRRRLITRAGHQGPESPFETAAGREQLVNFGSNDYLSLAADPRLAAAARAALDDEGFGAGASPLVCGHSGWHAKLEERLAEFTGCEAALVFSSGFAANVGTIAAFVGRGDAVFSAAANHASLIDGCRLSRAETYIFPHDDLATLAGQLVEARTARRRLIVCDSLFSMDGDVAPLAELAELAEQHQAMLLVDEAHATGVFGPRGAGLVEELGLERRTHIRVGTLSKALGAAGGFVAGSRQLIDWLLNRARPYVFSTAHPPAVAAAACAALAIVDHEPQRRRTLLDRAVKLRTTLSDQGWNVGHSTSQIVPIIVGPPERALALAAELRQQGLFVPAIRPPSVPADTSRLRISLCSGHSDEHLGRLIEKLAKLRRSP